MENKKYENRPTIEVGTVKQHGPVTSVYVDGVGAEIVGAYDLCKKNLSLRGEIQSKIMVAAVKALSASGKAEIVNGDRLMFVADPAKVNGKAKDLVLKTLTDLAANAKIAVEFDIAEAVSWINYVPAEDGSYTIASSYGNAWFIVNGDLASQRKARREAAVAPKQPQQPDAAPAAKSDPIDKLVDTIIPAAK